MTTTVTLPLESLSLLYDTPAYLGTSTDNRHLVLGGGSDLAKVQEGIANAVAHRLTPVASVSVELEGRFQKLAQSWKEQVLHLSSMSAIVNNTCYQEIVALGGVAIPLILRELEREPNHWFIALKVITKADPVRPDQRGVLPEMTQAWLKWGRDHGFRW